MTFTPQVLTQTDNNNTISNSTDISYNGISTITSGYNTLILTVNSTSDSLAGGIQILFSDDNSTWITPYTDTYFSTNIFTKNYLPTSSNWCNHFRIFLCSTSQLAPFYAKWICRNDERCFGGVLCLHWF